MKQWAREQRANYLDTAHTVGAAKGAVPNAEYPLACRRGVGNGALVERLPDGWRAKPDHCPGCANDRASQARRGQSCRRQSGCEPGCQSRREPGRQSRCESSGKSCGEPSGQPGCQSRRQPRRCCRGWSEADGQGRLVQL